MVGHGESSTSPIPSHCASIVVTSTLRVNAIFMCFADIRALFLSVFPPYLRSAIEYGIGPGT